EQALDDGGDVISKLSLELRCSCDEALVMGRVTVVEFWVKKASRVKYTGLWHLAGGWEVWPAAKGLIRALAAGREPRPAAQCIRR
ncbi:hypothetical protein Tco_0915477, partial [Tanacetum coccineum]